MNQFGPWCDNGFNQRGVSLCVELLAGDTLLLFSTVDDDDVAEGVILICKCLLLTVFHVSYARIFLSFSLARSHSHNRAFEYYPGRRR